MELLSLFAFPVDLFLFCNGNSVHLNASRACLQGAQPFAKAIAAVQNRAACAPCNLAILSRCLYVHRTVNASFHRVKDSLWELRGSFRMWASNTARA